MNVTSKRSGFARHRLTKTVLTVLCISGCADIASAEEKKQRVADLSYGNALYNYFQGNEIEALTQLLLAEVRGGIEGHGDNPELMQAGISLAYGMADEAQRIFVEMLDENRPETVRNAAWYYLARLHYLRENWSASQEAATRITENTSPALLPRIQILRTDLAIKTGDLASAEKLVADSESFGDFLPFAYFNIATAYSRRGNFSAAQEYYRVAVEAVYYLIPVTQDDLALLDKIRTAAGYNLLLAGENEAAITEFDQVQLDSLDADIALLGYGRAAIASEDYLGALKPWAELSKRSLASPAAQEALLSVPLAYEALGANGEALAAYEHAESVYLAEIDRLNELLAFLQENKLDAATLFNEPINWFETRANAASAPKVRQLAVLFSLNRFQAQVQEFQDISQLRELVALWRNRLTLYSGMLDERQLLRVNEQAKISALDIDNKIRDLEQKSSRLVDDLDRIRRDRDYLGLIEGNSAALLSRVQASEQRIAKLTEVGEPTEVEAERLARYRGLILWEAAENFSNALYVGQRSTNQIETELAKLKATRQRLGVLVSSAPDIAPYKTRISDLNSKLSSGADRLESLILASEAALLEEITTELDVQKRRLFVYLSQARLSIARLYDARTQGSDQ